LSEATARQLGYEGLPLVLVDQPFDRLPQDRVRAIAGEIADEVVRVLTTDAPTLRDEFTGRWRSSEGHGSSDACKVLYTNAST
jgi:hypothetical protein